MTWIAIHIWSVGDTLASSDINNMLSTNMAYLADQVTGYVPLTLTSPFFAAGTVGSRVPALIKQGDFIRGTGLLALPSASYSDGKFFAVAPAGYVSGDGLDHRFTCMGWRTDSPAQTVCCRIRMNGSNFQVYDLAQRGAIATSTCYFWLDCIEYSWVN